MGKMSLTWVAAMLLFTGSVLGNNPHNTDPPGHIKKLLKERLANYHTKPSFDLEARVLFIITQKHEIVVLSIETEDQEFAEWIKGRLNYFAVEPEETGQVGKFIISIRLKS